MTKSNCFEIENDDLDLNTAEALGFNVRPSHENPYIIPDEEDPFAVKTHFSSVIE